MDTIDELKKHLEQCSATVEKRNYEIRSLKASIVSFEKLVNSRNKAIIEKNERIKELETINSSLRRNLPDGNL